jgi:oxygen-independent coproporphyrinogen-3 oxidase
MDHFALNGQPVWSLRKRSTAKRMVQFLKNTVNDWFRVSSISDSWYSLHKTRKKIEDYYQILEWDKLPIFRGHLLTDEDHHTKTHLKFNVWVWDFLDRCFHLFQEIPAVLSSWKEMEKDGLLQMDNNSLQVTESGKPYIRNICMAFDLHLKRKAPDSFILHDDIKS